MQSSDCENTPSITSLNTPTRTLSQLVYLVLPAWTLAESTGATSEGAAATVIGPVGGPPGLIPYTGLS